MVVQGAVFVPISKELWPGWTDTPGGAPVPPKPYPGSPVGSPGQGFPKVGGMPTSVRNIIGQGVDDDDGSPAAGPVAAALSR